MMVSTYSFAWVRKRGRYVGNYGIDFKQNGNIVKKCIST